MTCNEVSHTICLPDGETELIKDLFEPQLTGAGYVQAVPRPQQQELNIFYQESYYAKCVTDIHHVSNSDDELKQKRLRGDCLVDVLAHNFRQKETVDFLEVGCGEGFVLSSAVEKGWNVSGVYYQSAPVSAFNPVMVPRVAATKVSWDLFYFRNVLDKYLQFYRAAFQYGVGRNICAVLKKHPLGG